MTIPSVPVPAAMPEESLVDQIAAFLLLRDEMVTDPDERTDDERAESAQAILDLFAPILAEKEREIADLGRLVDYDTKALAETRARALAAEAALAGERERAALICNPRRWTTEMSHAWHRAIPDVQKAFQDLAAAAPDSTTPPRS